MSINSSQKGKERLEWKREKWMEGGENVIDSFGRAALEFTEGGIGLEKKSH